MTKNSLKELIASIGGATVLLQILNQFYERMSKDVLIGYFFANQDLSHIALMQSQFLLKAAGISNEFNGKGPASAHLHLPPIYEGHFDRRLVILREVLQEQGLKPEQIEQWVQFEESFRKMIVVK